MIPYNLVGVFQHFGGSCFLNALVVTCAWRCIKCVIIQRDSLWEWKSELSEPHDGTAVLWCTKFISAQTEMVESNKFLNKCV